MGWYNHHMSEFDFHKRTEKQTQGPQLDTSLLHAQVRYFEPVYSEPKSTARPKRKYLSKALFVFVGIAFIFATFFSYKFSAFSGAVSAANYSFIKTTTDIIGSTIPGLGIFDNSRVGQAKRNGETLRIVLLGYGGAGHEGTYLTDSILLLSIDFKDGRTSFVSVPRDLWVEAPNGGYAKINSVFASAVNKNSKDLQADLTNGGNLAKQSISEVLGVPVDYFVAIDFDGFKEVVDNLGGVDVDVENGFTDYTYPSGNEDGAVCASQKYGSGCRYLVLKFEEGPQHMDGTRALEYSRSRHASGAEGSDFARSKRQQRLIAAIYEKIVQKDLLSRILSMVDAVEGHVFTDLGVADISSLSDYAHNVNFETAQRVALGDEEVLVPSSSSDGQWILVPRKGIGQYSEVHYLIKAKIVSQDLPRT
jgi:polyisoprenyl-teichoic acid--peptidoglycan teichoic acid transferase